MKKLEQKQSDQWSTTREGRKGIHFVREARSAQWKRTLSPESVAEIRSTWISDAGARVRVYGRAVEYGLAFPTPFARCREGERRRPRINHPLTFHAAYQNARGPAGKHLETLNCQTDS